jgi:hypothetical protein
MIVRGAEHYREIADMLRNAARACQFAGAEDKSCISRQVLKAGQIISSGAHVR